MINSFNLSLAILDRCDLPKVKVGRFAIDQPGLFAHGPDEKKMTQLLLGLLILIVVYIVGWHQIYGQFIHNIKNQNSFFIYS